MKLADIRPRTELRLEEEAPADQKANMSLSISADEFRVCGAAVWGDDFAYV